MAPGLTARASTPVDHVGLINLETLVVGGGEAGRRSDGAVDVDDVTAGPTNQVVVIVVDAVLVARGRSHRLDAAQESALHEDAEGVVDGLTRDGANLVARLVHDVVSAEVGVARDRVENGETLRGGHEVVRT